MPYDRIKKIFNPNSSEPFTISRSKLDLFYDCPRCFYMDCVFGISRPNFPPFTLNSAVDTLLKKEFDLLRSKGESHHLMEKHGIEAVPFNHKDLPKWRGEVPGYYYVGASFIHEETNFKLTGMVDDIWIDPSGDLIIVDYKATSTTKTISLDDEWKQAYKRQVEFYQWLFRQMGFSVSNTSYFVFANATKDRSEFDGRLEFAMSIIPHEGNDSWVENRVRAAKDCLVAGKIPQHASNCEYCDYRKRSAETVLKFQQKL